MSASGEDVTIDLASGNYGPDGFTIDGGSEASLTLDGAGQSNTILTGGGTDQTLQIGPTSMPVTIANMTLEDGTGQYGANLYVGDVSMFSATDVTVSAATNGSAVAVWDYVSGAEVSLTGVTVSRNAGSGFVVVNGSPAVTIAGSTFSANGGAGVSTNSPATASTVAVADSTFAGNSGPAVVWYSGGGSVFGSTVSGNAGGGVVLDGVGATSVTLGADVLSANSPDDCVNYTAGATFLDDGYNFADDASCPFTALTSRRSVPTGALMLGGLTSNGGPTQTMRMSNSSIGFDAVPTDAILAGETASFCSGADQRAVPRAQPSATGCDVGAYQFAPPVLTTVSPTAAIPGTAVTLSGPNLSVASGVGFGGAQVPATVLAQSSTSLTVAVPTVSPGPASITVTDPDGATQIPFTVLANTGGQIGTPPPPVPPATCAVSHLRLSLVRVLGATGHRSWDLAFKNTATTTCTLHGYPTVKLINSKAKAIKPKIIHNHLSKTQTLNLAAGQRAYFTLIYAIAGPCLPHSLTANGIAITPPGDQHRLVLHHQLHICDASLSGNPTISPLRPHLGNL
jgi:hypothetical protein